MGRGRGIKQSFCLEAPLVWEMFEGKSVFTMSLKRTNHKDWRAEAGIMVLPLQLNPRGISMPLLCFPSAVVLLIVTYTLKNYLVNTSFKTYWLRIWGNMTYTREECSWNTSAFIYKAFNHLPVFSFWSQEYS